MELVAFVLYGIVKVLPAKAAMPVIAAILVAVGGLSLAWHGSLAAAVDFCQSTRGRFDQLFNGAATTNCGIDNLLAIATLIVGIGLIVLALIPAAVWIYQLTHPNFDLKEFADDAI